MNKLASPRAAWSVVELLHAVQDLLAHALPAVTVQGELSGFSRSTSGHCYFNLKDSQVGAALLRCAMFRRAASLVDFAPADGQAVEVRGRLTLYEPRGELQLVVEALRPAGAGALYEKFLRTRLRLEAEGLFDTARKREVSQHPRRVAVVTSLGAAALHDVLTALARRASHVEVVVIPCTVQGSDAPVSIAAAIACAASLGGIDTLLVCRGGGSIEDLWAFNDEVVARAIAGSAIPVVCGVGHETDVTLADLAADLRAPTPTAAAEMASRPRDESMAQLRALATRAGHCMRRAIDTFAQRLDRHETRLLRPGHVLRLQAHALALLAHRMGSHRSAVLPESRSRLHRVRLDLARCVQAHLDGQRRHLDTLAARLQGLDPDEVLRRGYAWLVDGEGHAVTSVRRLRDGEAVRAVLRDGSAEMVVRAVTGRTST